jgi:hypothetical protein
MRKASSACVRGASAGEARRRPDGEVAGGKEGDCAADVDVEAEGGAAVLLPPLMKLSMDSFR